MKPKRLHLLLALGLMTGLVMGAAVYIKIATAVETENKTGHDSTISSLSTTTRHPPVFYMMQVVKGETSQVKGWSDNALEQQWQQKTLSQDPVLIAVTLVKRLSPDDNQGRRCARVKTQLGQERVPLKGKTYQDCSQAVACKPFYIIAELDMCEDGLPPTENFEKYKKEAANKEWRPPLTELK